MIAFALFSLCVVAYRIRKGLFNRTEGSLLVFGAADRPDYWVTGHHDEEFVRDEYELMDTFICGKRRFDLYKHKEERGL